MNFNSRNLVTLITVSLTGILCASPVLSQETATAKKGKLEIHTNLPGIFVADDKDEIKLEPRKYKGDLVVTSILNEGVYVSKGDLLIEFDTDNVDEALEEAQNEATDANVELQKAKAEHQSAQIEMDAKKAQREVELTHLRREVEAQVSKQKLELAKKERAIKDAEYQLTVQQDDFETLRQMYDEREIDSPVSGDILFDREKKSISRTEKRIDVLKKELAYFMKFDETKVQLEKELEVEKKLAEIKKEEITLQAAVAEKQAEVDKAQRKMDVAMKRLQTSKPTEHNCW